MPPEERRQAIVAATLPLLIEHGSDVTTRQIAEAAGIAEGTIFRVFPDKEALIEAALEKALDPGPLEARLVDIDPTLALDERLRQAVQIMQERIQTVWRLISAVGWRKLPANDESATRNRAIAGLTALAELFEADRDTLRYDPMSNARRLRAITMGGSHPALLGDDPLTADEIVSMFLDGVRLPPPPPATA
jgi:AcrR family transcriptional regulator